MQSAHDESIDPKHYARMFWRRKGLIALCAVTVVCSAMVALEFVPEEYEAEASLLIEERHRLASQLESIMGGMRRPSTSLHRGDDRMDELTGRIRSRPFLEKVVRLLHMHEDPVVAARAQSAAATRPNVNADEVATRICIGELRDKITFGRAGTGIYKIIVADHDPKNAQILAKWVAELFVDVSIQSSLDELKTTHDFGEEQMRIYEEKLKQSERALAQYQQSKIQEDFSRSIVRAGNVATAEALYQRVLDEADLARLRILPYARTVSEAGLEATRSQLIEDSEIRNQAAGLTSTLEEALTDRLLSDERNVGEWPPGGSYLTLRRGLLQLIERRVVQLQGSEKSEALDSLVRLVFSTLDHDAHADAAEFLGQAISDFRSKAQSAPSGEMELARLRASVTTNRELLESFQAQLIASEVSQAMEMTDLGLQIEILDPPQVPLAPARPDRRKILLAAMVLGPLMGAALAFISELLDSTLRSLADFERVFPKPVLGTTPLISRVQSGPSRVRRYWVPAALTGVVLVTLLFFLTRDTLFADMTSGGDSMRIIDPGEQVSP